MQILPKIKCKYGEGIGVEIFITPPDIRDNPYTFITTDASSAASSFSVDNGLKFAIDQYIIIGNIGAEKTEILRTHASTAPTATTITLDATTSSHAHSRGERIQFIPYNQVAIEYSTDGATYSALTTINIRIDAESTYYNHTAGLSTYYYRVKFKNEADTAYSPYSDGIIATGYAENSVGKIINNALISLGENIDNEVITKEFLYSVLNEGRNEIDRHQMIEKWSFRTVFDYDAGNVIPGQYKLTLPTDLRDPATYKNILAVYIGKSKLPLQQIDKRALNNYYQGIAHTTLNGAVATSDTEITLTSSGDFDASGTVSVAAQAVNEKIDVINYDTVEIEATTIAFVEGGASADTITDSGNGFLTTNDDATYGFYAGQTITVSGSTSNDGTYTIDTATAGTLTLVSTDDLTAESAGANVKIVSNEANVVSTNILTDISGIRAAGHATGTDVWQGASFGSPQEYTVDNGVMIFSCPFNDDLAGENIWLDYYKKITDINSDADTLDEPFYNIYIPYLKYKIKLRKNPQMNVAKDPDYLDWIQKREAQVSKEWLGQDLRIEVDIP